MPVVIRLLRTGAKKRPSYRVVAADSRRQRDGRFLEILGHYNPLVHPYELVVHKDKVEKWLSHGAQPSEQAASLLRSVGITLGRPSAPKKKPAAAADATGAAKKKAVKRAAPRVQSARKTQKKAARKAVAKSATKAATSKPAKA